MASSLVLISGFEPFLNVEVNPSGELVRLFERDAPAGLEVAGVVLPVSFEHAPPALDAALARIAGREPVALLGLGVQREDWFRLERRARARLTSTKPDNNGHFASEVGELGERDLETSLDLERLREALLNGGAEDARLSEDAGGYLCERTYYGLLKRAQELGVPALFLHLPPLDAVGINEQLVVVRAVLVELVRQGTQG